MRSNRGLHVHTRRAYSRDAYMNRIYGRAFECGIASWARAAGICESKSTCTMCIIYLKKKRELCMIDAVTHLQHVIFISIANDDDECVYLRKWRTNYIFFERTAYAGACMHYVRSAVTYYTFAAIFRCIRLWVCNENWLPWFVYSTNLRKRYTFNI